MEHNFRCRQCRFQSAADEKLIAVRINGVCDESTSCENFYECSFLLRRLDNHLHGSSEKLRLLQRMVHLLSKLVDNHDSR